MQTKSTIMSSAILFLTTVLATPVENYNAAMPTLSSYNSVPEWERWSATLSQSPSSVVLSNWDATATSSAVAVAAVTPTSSAVEASTTTAPYSNPFTIYTTQTDSRGVITGMPSVVTSQPSVVTSQPSVAMTVAGAETTSHYTNSTTMATVKSSSSSLAASSASGSFAQGTTTGSIPVHTGGAVRDRVTGAAVALVVLGLGFAML